MADFVWCPEGLREADAHLLGEVAGRRILEVGAGSAMCSRWLATQGARPTAVDLSGGMLGHARAGAAATGIDVPLVQADAQHLPFREAAFDVAFTAFGAVPFVADSARVMREVARVLRPGRRWVFATSHPFRWVFPDDPGPLGLTATMSYFDRTPYVEIDQHGETTYVEHHRTLGDRVAEINAAGFRLVAVIEPEWPAELTQEWGNGHPCEERSCPAPRSTSASSPEVPRPRPDDDDGGVAGAGLPRSGRRRARPARAESRCGSSALSIVASWHSPPVT